MNLLFTSDLHGLEPAYRDFSRRLKEGNYDVGVLAGDLMTFPSEADFESAKSGLRQTGTVDFEPGSEGARRAELLALREMERSFKELLALSGKPVVFVMGNDDGILGDGAAWKSEGRIVNIHMRRARYGNTGFVGYQYTSPFIGGTFEKSDEAQKDDFAALGAMIDEATVLVTHGPALGTLDTGHDGQHHGSRALARLVERGPPRLHLFGHIHQSFGIDGTRVNGSYPLSRQFVAIDVDAREARTLQD
jgi:Icc-related predicted phosphoesterase